MITLDTLRGLNDKNTTETTERVEITFQELKLLVIERIKRVRLESSLEEDDFKAITEKVIRDYISVRKPRVDGYVKDGNILEKGLVKDLEDSILSWGILTDAKENPDIREIQINGPSIFIDRENGYELYRDEKGEPIRFTDPDESFNFLQGIMMYSGDRLQADSPFVNSRSIEGFRIAATHPSVYPPHPTTPTVKWPTAVIRKIGDKQFSREDFIKYGTFHDEMADSIEAFARAKKGFVVVGTTGCGKSTILGYYANSFTDDARILALQNPTEINIMKMRDNVMMNNFIPWEMKDDADPDNPYSPSLDHGINHSLRYTADALLLGEIRSSIEFAGAARASNTGTEFSTTFHTFSVIGALDRFALELSSYLRIDIEVARELACSYLTIIAHAHRVGDGTRKIMDMTEVRGYDRVNKKYILNKLYGFKSTKVVVNDDDTRDIHGHFLKYNNISSELQENFRLAAMTDEEMGTMLWPEDELDVENGVILGTVAGRRGFIER